MKIKPETDDEIDWVRKTADGLYIPTPTLSIIDACKAWVKKHPARPGPGSVLQWNRPGPDRIRIVREDGGLMSPTGFISRTTDDWVLGNDRYSYTVLFDIGEAK